MEDKIIRGYPIKKDIGLYTNRYTQYDFYKYDDIKKNPENYEKWKLGINYKTNRKIKIGGKIHNQIGDEKLYTKKIDFDKINIEQYLNETEDIKKTVISFNDLVDHIIIKINLLEKWEDYIEFDGKKYGINYVQNNIHMENNCLGIMEKDYFRKCTCSSCENWYGCGNEGTQYYKCNKCNYRR